VDGFYGKRKELLDYTRRKVLRVGSVVVLTQAIGCSFDIQQLLPNNNIAFRRSGRDGHVSNAAKKHNANRIYATWDAASLDLPHPGDKSKVVQITLSNQRYAELFTNGNLIADLRWKS